MRLRVRGVLRGRADDDDVLQRVWMGVHRHAAGFRWASRVSTWLYQIATCESLMALRTRPAATLTVGMVDMSPPPDELAEQRRTIRRVRAVMRTLPPEQRAAFLLGVLDPRPFRPTNTERSQLHYGRARLRRCV